MKRWLKVSTIYLGLVSVCWLASAQVDDSKKAAPVKPAPVKASADSDDPDVQAMERWLEQMSLDIDHLVTEMDAQARKWAKQEGHSPYSGDQWAKQGKRWAEIGERWAEQGRRMAKRNRAEAHAHKLEAHGEQFERQMERFGEEMERWAESFAKRMERFGERMERFAEQMERSFDK